MQGRVGCFKISGSSVKGIQVIFMSKKNKSTSKHLEKNKRVLSDKIKELCLISYVYFIFVTGKSLITI